MNWRKICVVNIFVMFSIITSFCAYGKIPEPENIIYGVTRENTVDVVAKINGVEIDSFSVSNNPDLAPYYVLRLPIDSLDPQDAGTARAGDFVTIYINGGSVAAATAVVAEKGTVTKLHLATEDSDGDGLLDSWEKYYFASLTVSDGSGDFDHDGVSDLREFQRDTRPTEKNQVLPGPNIVVTPLSPVDFGTVVISGGISSQTLTVTNQGDADLIVGVISISGVDAADFSINDNNCSGHSLAPNTSRTVTVDFDAAFVGEAKASLTIISNDSDTPDLTVELSGTGVDGNVLYVCNHSTCNPNFTVFATVQGAYDASSDAGEIWVTNGFYFENLIFDDSIIVILRGGWDDDYKGNSGNCTVVDGAMEITAGTVIIEGVVLGGTTCMAGTGESEFGCWAPDYRSQESCFR